MNQPQSSTSKAGKEFILLMAAIMSVTALSIDAMLPALTAIGENLRVADIRQTQFVVVCFFAGMSLGQLFCGPLSDALGRRRLLFGSLVVYLAGTVVSVQAQQLEILLLGRFLQGLGSAGPYVSTVSIVRDRFRGAAMASVMSLVTMIFIMVPVVAPALGQLVLLVASWREIFWVLFGYASLIMFWAWHRLRETLPAERRIPFHPATMLQGARTVLGTRSTLCYMICAGCIFGILIGYLNSCLMIFRELFGVGDAFALYFGGLALTLGLASLLNSRLVERFGMRAICQRALGLVLAASLGLLVYAQLFTVSLVPFMVYALLLFFAMGLIFGNINALAMEPMGNIAGTASALVGCFSSIVSISTGTAIGLAYNQTVVPLVVGAVVLVSVALVLMQLAVGPVIKQPASSLADV